MTLSLSKLFVSCTSQCLKRTRSYKGITFAKLYLHSTKQSYRAKCTEGPFYKTRLALPPDYGNVVNFMRDSYYKCEPVIVNMGLDGIEPPASLMSAMHEQVREGMTIIAEDRENCILGAAVNIRSCPWDPDRALEFARCCVHGPFRDVIEFFAYVTRKPELWSRHCIQKIFECSCLAVDPEFQGLGVARKLVEESWYLARDCGYRLFRIDCTSRYTAKIAEGFGWERVCTIPYCRYVKDDRIVFQNIKEPHTEVQVYIDRVRYCKTYCLPSKKCKKTGESKLPEKTK